MHNLTPLAFVRSGVIYPNNGTAGYVGNNGYWWARTAKSSTHAYLLYTYSGDVSPSGSSNRYNGFPLRCLYTV